MLLLPSWRRAGAWTALASGCGLLSATCFLHWGSAFWMGNSVSDELPPHVGTLTGVGAGFLLAVPVFLVLGAIALGLALGAYRPQRAGAAG